MRFRYRGGAKGYVAGKDGRAVGNAYAGDDVGSCILIIILFILVVGGSLGIAILIGLAMMILPSVVLVGIVLAIGAITYYAIKNQYPQKVMSWFFLKENEVDGTVLPFSEIKNRLHEPYREYTEKQ